MNPRRPKRRAQCLREQVLLSFGAVLASVGAEERATSLKASPLTAPLVNSVVGMLQLVYRELQNDIQIG